MWSITAKQSDDKYYLPFAKKPAPDLKAGFFMGEADFCRMNSLDDGQVNHCLVEQLVANFAESHWAGDMSGALALKV